MATWHDETRIVLELPFPIKSQNKFHGKHWSVKHEDRMEWAKVIRAITHQIPMQRLRATGPRAILFVSNGMHTDLSNIIGGAKGFIDALVDYGILIDDRPMYLPHVACMAGDQKKMHVIISEAVYDKKEARKYLGSPVQEQVASVG